MAFRRRRSAAPPPGALPAPLTGVVGRERDLAAVRELVLRPDVAFVDGNPLLLSVEGEYVVKNLVLLAATASLALHALGPRPRTTGGRSLWYRPTWGTTFAGDFVGRRSTD